MADKKTIVVTGVTGFVGSNLLKELENVYKVKPITARFSAGQHIDFEEAMAVIHLAGKAHDTRNTTQAQAYDEANFELTRQLYDAFLRSKADCFIFISSVKAVAEEVSGILTEAATPAPGTPYGISKRKAEEYIIAQQLPAGKRYYILRPCMIHGPGNKGNLNLLYKFVSAGIPYPLTAFENKRSFLSIRNLCFVLVELLSNDHVATGIYNVADDEALSTIDLVRLISSSMNKKPRLLQVPKGLIIFLAKIGDRLGLPLNTERLRKLTGDYVVGNGKIRKALGKPLPVKAADGLRETLASFTR